MRGRAGRNGLFVSVLAAMCLLPAGACALQAHSSRPAASSASAASVSVVRVTDGDTIHVDNSGRNERVRLIGVNTPEVATYGGSGECFGDAAAAYATRRLLGRRVDLRFDVARRDPYGRILAYVYLGPELFNLTLVRMGYARADPVPPDVAMAGAFASAERRAEDGGEGLWSACRAP